MKHQYRNKPKKQIIQNKIKKLKELALSEINGCLIMTTIPHNI